MNKAEEIGIKKTWLVEKIRKFNNTLTDYLQNNSFKRKVCGIIGGLKMEDN